jgi:hypothetical protein
MISFNQIIQLLFNPKKAVRGERPVQPEEAHRKACWANKKLKTALLDLEQNLKKGQHNDR